MKIETCFESIEQSIDSISSLEFNYPRHFTNSLLKLKNIATLIRDAELHENMLFTVEKGQKEPQKTKQCFKMPVTPLKSKESLSPETLLIAAKRLLDICHFPEMEERIALLYEKNRKHLETIENLETKIDLQRRQLDMLSTNNHLNFEDKSEFITDEMIQYEKDEIERLEHELELKSKELYGIL
ncbi:uncharacterized protein T551_01595 [Pneumocystis jirovecii RU7]|uniref:DASH complex subunit SPC34 n=1 Tax=Pneumocystis jirovecii (strain RU7) TaxID=1408657 RepID=A0A0W4ZRN9_PNEJ7|nr:uncharacterized protein T551_01595 [Pneumocystis jirovecii RU7]KTW31043.1 hypothetical protein T551_01595 [Pneumocystis jirovecii RU7]